MNVEHIFVHLAFELIEVSVCRHGDALIVAKVRLLVPRAKAIFGTNNQVVVFANNAHFAWVQILWECELHGDKFLVFADNWMEVQLVGANALLCQRYFDDQLVFAYHVGGQFVYLGIPWQVIGLFELLDVIIDQNLVSN